MLAFFSESKSVTIFVNRYGEQYADLISLFFIWTICILGLIALYKIIKEEKRQTSLKNNNYQIDIQEQDRLYMGDMNSSPTHGSIEFINVSSKSPEYIDLESYKNDNS